ncbi:MAG: type IV toxin-antitoxin system AbiEi family antitoxin [bacterium]
MNMKHDTPMKTLGSQAAHLVTSLYQESKNVFHLEDVRRILGLDDSATRNLVRKLVNRGVATRLKPGLFILVPYELGLEKEYMGSPLIVARELVNGKNYYLSHGTAMEIHGMVTQPQFVFYVTTPEKRRPVRIMGTDFRFITCKKEHFFGTVNHWVTKQEQVRISDLEKTMIDSLYQPEYCGGITEAAKGIWLRRQDVKVGRLIDYALKMEVGTVIRRLGYLLELYAIGSPRLREALRNHLTESYARMDPILPAEGKFIRKWRLQLNVSPNELLAATRT